MSVDKYITPIKAGQWLRVRLTINIDGEMRTVECDAMVSQRLFEVPAEGQRFAKLTQLSFLDRGCVFVPQLRKHEVVK